MGSYPLGSNHQKYGYAYQQQLAQNEAMAEEDPSLLSSANPHANSMPITGAHDNRVISNKTIKKHAEEMQKAIKPKKRSFFQKIRDFFKGIGKAIKNIFKSLANPKTWLLIGAAIALCIIWPPAGVILAGVGAAMATTQIAKGVKSGNWEQVGEGTFNLGLSVIGFKAASGSVKSGGSKFTLSGTRSADANANLLNAEQKLTALQKAGASTAEINKAKVVVAEATHAQKAAMANQARIDTARMNWFSKQSFLKKTGTKNLSANQVQVRLAQSTENLGAARANLAESEIAVKSAAAGGNKKNIALAEANRTTAQANLIKATDINLDLIKADRIKQLQGMDMTQRAKVYAKDQVATTKDSIGTASGKTLTTTDGRTVSYWKRTPKGPNSEALPATANSGSAMDKVKGWWSPKTASAEGAAATPQKATGMSVPKPGGGSVAPPDPSTGQDSQSISNSAKVANEAIATSWQQWRESQKVKDAASTAWENQFNALVPVTELSHHKQGNNYSAGNKNNSNNGSHQFNLEVPA